MLVISKLKDAAAAQHLRNLRESQRISGSLRESKRKKVQDAPPVYVAQLSPITTTANAPYIVCNLQTRLLGNRTRYLRGTSRYDQVSPGNSKFPTRVLTSRTTEQHGMIDVFVWECRLENEDAINESRLDVI
jgi:hypothetical protein